MNCGEIEKFSTCGEISDVSTCQMWRNLKSPLMACVWCRKRRHICKIYALSCGEKFNSKVHLLRKITNNRSGNKEKMRKWLERISLHFLILSPFPHYHSISSPFPHSLSISSSFFHSLSISCSQAATICTTLLCCNFRLTSFLVVCFAVIMHCGRTQCRVPLPMFRA